MHCSRSSIIGLLLLLALSDHCFGWWPLGKSFSSPPQRHQEEAAQLSENIQATELRMPGVIPQKNETYLCTSFPLDPEEEHYIVGFEPLANSHQIHHVIVYGCEMPGSDEEAWDCGEMASSKGRYSHSPVCAYQPDIIYAWAHDAPKLILPEGVGFRVGGRSKAQHLILQVHYMHKMDKADQSGVRILHTEEPQPRTAATLLLATDGRMAPKKTEQLEVACVVDEPVELHPFAFRVHTHRHGTMVGGWLVQEDPETGVDQWTLLGQRDPQAPQLFQQIKNQRESRD